MDAHFYATNVPHARAVPDPLNQPHWFLKDQPVGSACVGSCFILRAQKSQTCMQTPALLLLTRRSWENYLTSLGLSSLTFRAGFILNEVMHAKQQASSSLSILSASILPL